MIENQSPLWSRYKKARFCKRLQNKLRFDRETISIILQVKMISTTPNKAKQADHPKYNDMIKAALLALKDRSGTSRQAILKYIMVNFNVGNQADYHVKTAIKRMTIANVLIQTKGKGASGSFKLSQEAKKQPIQKKTVYKPKTEAVQLKKKVKKIARKTATKSPVKKPTQPAKKKRPSKEAQPKNSDSRKRTNSTQKSAKNLVKTTAKRFANN